VAYEAPTIQASNALLGTISVEVDGAYPQPGNDAGSPHQHLVVRGANSGMLGHTTLGDMVLALGSSGAMDLGIVGLLLSGYLDSPLLPVN
jgi:hypothetical protein